MERLRTDLSQAQTLLEARGEEAHRLRRELSEEQAQARSAITCMQRLKGDEAATRLCTLEELHELSKAGGGMGRGSAEAAAVGEGSR